MRPERAARAHHFEALGTSCSLFGVGLAERRLLEGEEWVREMGARLTRFSGESELMALNRSAGRWCEITEEMEDVLRAAYRAFEASGGLVNVAVQPAMVAIGYARPMSEAVPVATADPGVPLPALHEVLEIRPGAARLSPGSGLDLGGIAKGWMADRLAQMLGRNVLANLGGDLMAVGVGPDGAGWPVSVAGTTLLLRDHGAATSSVRRRRWGRAHHLVDPRTGLPSTSGLEEVSVVASCAVDAEVIAKTALLAGPDVAPGYCAARALAWWLSP